jgi:general stress protein 26
MRTDPKNPADVEHRLWDDIESHNTGMLLPVGGPPVHAQPMTAFPERSSRQLWFFTRSDTDLVRQIGKGSMAMFILQQRELQACIGGELHVQYDPARMERYWNAVVAAWHPGGRNDPKLTMLALDCHDAQVWLSEAGPMKFAWEIAKANATRHMPDLGGRTHLQFN